ncbi:MAG: YqgE/AlgH family protein [Desulfobulbaceae bacterium]|nr:YqgE/AlgH family protein [Desulfobulbaceae bacterium]HIJ91068.1 YqgE/AlgH family protein [Deltaproteobacteria bacterium]
MGHTSRMIETLQGYFLIATPQMPDPRFAGKVVYLCAHNDEGAMGLVVNEPIAGVSMAEVFASADIPQPPGLLSAVYLGGPVEVANAFFLYSSEYRAQHFLEVSKTVHLSSDPQLLYDLASGRGPKNLLVALGYSGWGPGQLEAELSVDGWLTLPADDDIIFHTPDSLRWQKAARRHGIDIALFGDVVGSA